MPAQPLKGQGHQHGLHARRERLRLASMTTTTSDPAWLQLATLLLQGAGVGLIGVLAAWLTSRAQSEREEANSARRLRGSARLIRDDIRTWQDVYHRAMKTKKWWSEAESIPRLSTRSDLRRIAEDKDDFEDWASVPFAIRLHEALEQRRTRGKRFDVQQVARAMKVAEVARQSLANVDGRQFKSHEGIPLTLHIRPDSSS